jgi:hypothetical protein
VVAMMTIMMESITAVDITMMMMKMEETTN